MKSSGVRAWLPLSLMATAAVLAVAGTPVGIVAVFFGLGALTAWTVSPSISVLCYLCTLAVQIVQTLALFRVAVADALVLPAIFESSRRLWRGEIQKPLSSLTYPLALLLVAFAIGNIMTLMELGGLTSYTIFNKDIGFLFLVAVYVTLIVQLSSRARIEQAMTWFVGGVSVANITCLTAAGLTLIYGQNLLYDSSINRMFGWMQNPTLTGGVLMTAGLVELSLLRSIDATGSNVWLRWGNVWLLALGIAMTLSRSTWLAVGCGAAVLIGLTMLFERRPRKSYLLAASVWALVPAIVLGNIARVNMSAGVTNELTAAADNAAQLQARLVSQCEANPSLEVCAQVSPPEPPETTSASKALLSESPETPSASEVIPSTTADPRAAAAAAGGVDGPLDNVRGLSDRVAITGIGLREYGRSLRRAAFGIGVGTFFATSAVFFGVPLIIHNTFVWFLVEMGPLGLIAVAWIWVLVSRNLWLVCRSRDWRAPAGIGVAAAFAAMTVFCVMNEGFYQRHLWFLFVLSDRLRMMANTDEYAHTLDLRTADAAPSVQPSRRMAAI